MARAKGRVKGCNVCGMEWKGNEHLFTPGNYKCRECKRRYNKEHYRKKALEIRKHRETNECKCCANCMVETYCGKSCFKKELRCDDCKFGR